MSNTNRLRQTANRIKQTVRRRKIKRRRRKLVAAYAKVGRTRHGLGPGFSPLLYAYDQLMNEGLLVIVEKGDARRIVWNWPDEQDPESITWGEHNDVAAEATPREPGDIFEEVE